MRCLFFLMILLSTTFALSAQTVHIPTAQGGFENAGGFTGNGWTVVNSTLNTWVVGSTAGPATGVNSAYISNNGTNFVYTPSSVQTSHFYRDITVPAGQTLISLSFKFKCVGEAFFDRLLVYTAPTTVNPVANVPASSSSTLTGATLVYSDLGNTSSYSNVNLILPQALAGTTFRLIFTWQNDATGTANSPVSIDDIALISSTGGPLNGSYTINPSLPTSATIPASGSNFNSFSAAVNYLNNFGVSGPVNFQVAAGSVHNEPLLSINLGGSATDTIAFVKNGLGANPLIIPARGTTTSDASVLINGADYITFDGIDISAPISPATAQENIEFGYYIKNASATNGARNCRIKNANITLSNNFNSNVAVYIHASTAPTNITGANSFNIVDSVTVLRSYVGIRDLSNTTIRNEGTVVRNCTAGISAANPIGNPTLATTTAAIQVLNSSNITVRGNTVKYVSVSTAVDGIFVQNALGLNTVSHNKVSGVRNSGTASTQVAAGIRITLAAGASANVFNNFVYDISHAYTTVQLTNKLVKGISIQPLTVVGNTTVFNVDFNSILLDGSLSPNVSSTCLDVVQSGPVVNVRNNILANITPNQAGNPAHYCITVPTTTIAAASSISNRNDFYCPFPSNGFVGQTATTNQALLSNWIAATGLDINSFAIDPQFISTTNLHILSPDLDSAASFSGITWITDDIDGDVRSTTVPDIGADEFSLVLFDIEMQALLQPTGNSGCFTNNQNVRVRIKNLAGQSHDFSSYPVFVQIDVSGAINTQLLTQINDNSMVAGPLGSLQSILYDAGTINMTANGNYNFRCKVYFPEDQYHLNDSLSSPVVINNAFPISLPSSVSFTGYNGTNLDTAFPDWNEATGQNPTINNSPWTSVTGLGTSGNVTSRLNLNTAGAYNWIMSKKMRAASNSLLTFDAAVCTPFAFTRDTLGLDDRLDVMISTDCGLTYFKLDSFDYTDGWNQNLQSEVISLSQFNGQDIIVGLRAYSGATTDNDCDLHLDNIMLFNSSAADLELKEILQPLSTNCFTAASAVQLTIANVGFIDLNFANTPLIVFMRTSGAQSQLISDTINSGSLAQGTNMNISLSDSLNLTVPGQYFLDAFLVLSGGDVNIDNDTNSIMLISQNPTAALNTSRDTVCFSNNAIIYSDASANGLGINNLPAFNYTGLPVAIPDGNPNGIMIPLNISGTAGFASQLVSVEIANLTHQYIAEVRLELVAPNGSKTLLSELLGGSGTAYTNTVFRMNALSSISTASAPFTGSFLPIQNFNQLTGPANGTWHLKVTDLANGDLGSVTAWNLVFREPNSLLSHSWQSPLQNVSSNVDSAIYTVNQNNLIIYTATDVYGCQIRDSFNIFSTQDVQWNQAPITACGINNIPLSGATPAGGYYFGNGVVNDTLRTALAGSGTQSIKYFYLSAGCLDSASVTANISLITLSAGNLSNVNCNGNSTGSATVLVAQPSGAVTYLWNDASQQTTATANNLPAGNYTVTVTDAVCSAQFNFTVTQPSQLIANATQSNLSCFGTSSGSIDLTVSGAQSPYSYSWSNGASTQDLSSLNPGLYTVTIVDANNCSRIESFTITSPAALSGSTQTQNPLCNAQSNASINLTMNGGVQPYTYNWSNGSSAEDLSNLIAGTYTVTVTDANLCTQIISANVIAPSAFNVNVNVTNLLCNGSGAGSINLTVSGAVAPYTYLWSNNATTEDIANLVPAVYSVTITDINGCTVQESATITVPTSLSTTVSVTDLPCNASGFGSIDLSAGGGIPPYSYLWSNGATTEDLNNLAVGIYNVSVSDVNACSATRSVTVSEPSALSLNLQPTNISCNNETNGSINLNANGGTSPYSFIWSNNATTEDISGLSAGTFGLTISDANGCSATNATSITQPAPYSISAQISFETLGNDGAINLDVQGATTPYTYIWNNGETTEDLSGIIGGNYTVTVIDANNCDTVLTFNVPTVVSVNQLRIDNALKLYPNPASDLISLSAEYPLIAEIITIFDAAGKEIVQYHNTNLPLEMDTNNLSPGLYIIRVQESNNVSNLKFVKKQ